MNKKQETNPNNNPISKQEKKLKKRKWIIVSTIFGISSVVIFTVTFTNMAKSIAINNEMKETVKKNRELIDKLKSDADLDAKDKLSKIQTFTKMRSNTVSTNNLKNFIVKKTPVAFHDDAYNETINFAKTDLMDLLKNTMLKLKTILSWRN